MRTLFMHGMGECPKEWELDGMLKNGLSPYALHLDYCHAPEFELLSEFIENKRIEFLIGRSYGGYLSYWLSHKYGIPCLIINPYLSLRLRKQMQPPFHQRNCPLCLVVLGSDDLIVDPQRTLLYFKKAEINNDLLKINILEGVGHDIESDTFSEQIVWAKKEIGLMKTK